MKSNYLFKQLDYLPRTAIAREQKQFIKIAFAVHLSAVISAERYRSDSGALKSAVFNFVFFIMLKNKIEQSAAQSCLGTFELRVLPFGKISGIKVLNLLNRPTDRTFGNRWSRYKEPSKNKAEAYRVYVEHLFLRSDAGDARIFSKDDVYGADYGFGLDAPKETEQTNPQDLFAYRRNYTWNERNLLSKSSDRNYTVHYRYGEDGQRALKYTDEGRSETLYFNNFFTIHIPTQDQNNPQGLRVHKHIFVGNSRLVTAMTHTENQGDNEEQKAKRYYYHSDHLGSAQFVTDWRGRQYEHIEYTPYGELWIEEVAAGLDKLPFRFTGKELDEETGLYYYGARYLDPKYSRWLSGDPALGEYIPSPRTEPSKLAGMGGVYNTINLHLYHYAGNNPVKYTDPDGRDIIYLNDQSAVGGNGHGAMLIGNDKDGWIYYSKDGPFESNKDIDPIDDNDRRRRTENGNFKSDKYKTIEAFNEDKAVSGRYNRRVRIKTSRAEDARMTAYANEHWDDKYNFGIENCSDLVLDTMYSSGNSLLGFALSLGSTDEFFPLTSPNRLYDTLNSIYGESFTSRLGSRIKNKFGVLPRMLVDYLFPKR